MTQREVKLPVFCTVGTVARLGSVSRHMSTQRVRECRGRRVNAGGRVLIAMAEIEKKIPMLFQSLQLVASTRRRREEGKAQR